MEGSEKGRTITIKINGKQREYDERLTEDKRIVTEIEKNERLIESKEPRIKEETVMLDEIAAARELEEEDQFDWVLPEETIQQEVKEFKIATPKKKNAIQGLAGLGYFHTNKQKRLLTSIFITVFCAVVLGTSFGFIMLKLVITENAVETEKPAVAEPSGEQKEQPKGTESVALAPLETFVIQGGVFSNIETAKQISNENIQKGIASQALQINGQAVVYLSVAGSIEDAKSVGAQLKGKGFEVFAKPITFGGKTIEGLLPEERKIVESVPVIYAALAEGVADAGLHSALSAAAIEKIEAHSKILITEGDHPIKNEGIMTLNKELSRANEQLNLYKKSKDPDLLTEAQQHLLGFLAAYQAL